jgi:hypothetical protein
MNAASSQLETGRVMKDGETIGSEAERIEVRYDLHLRS